MRSRTTEMVRVLAVYLAFLSFFAGCSLSCEVDNDENKVLSSRQSLSLPYSGEICFDTTRAYFEDEIFLLSNVSEGLFRVALDKEGNEKNISAGCSSYVVSTDGKRYMFYLRRDCLWSDGKRVVASDYSYAWKKLVENDESVYSFYARNIKDIECIDDYSFYADLYEPDSSFIKKLSMVCFFPQRKDADSFSVTARPSNGPFIVSSYTEDSIVLLKNETYWNRVHVTLDEIDFHLCKSEMEEASMFENGELDAIFLSNPELLKKFSAESKRNEFCFKSLKSSFLYYFAFNLNKDKDSLNSRLLENSSVRLALSLAIDRRQMNELFFDGREQPACSVVPEGICCGSFDYRKNVEESLSAYDAQLKIDGFLKQLFERGLRECGYTQKDGPIVFTVYSGEGETFSRDLFAWMDSQFETKLGVHIKAACSNVPPEDLENLDAYDMYLTDWSSDYDDPSGFLDVFYDGSNGILTGGYQDRFYSMLISASDRTLDEEERLRLFAKAEDYLVNSAGCVPLIFMKEYECVKNYVKGESLLSCGPSVDVTSSFIIEH